MRDARSSPTLALLALALVAAGPASPFERFDLPDDWEARFWAGPDAQAFLKLEPKALAALVPTQAGLRFCRCPACDAPEADDPLGWSIRKPDVVTCKRCGASFPDDKFPAKAEKDKKVPEEVVEVAPGILHKYPYHEVEPERQRRPDERLYLAARRDYEAREFLAKAALYAAVRSSEQAPRDRDPALARSACVVLIRFAQVYPNYAQHLDQPGKAKSFEPARRPPPYRRGYATAKWDWSGSLDVPIPLAIAHARLRQDPAMAEAGKLLGVADPSALIERDLFRTSAAFVRDQPREPAEPELQAIRGLLVVGRLLGDEAILSEARARLDEFGAASFYFDGLFRDGDGPSHRRVVAMFDGWIDRWLPPSKPDPGPMTRLDLARSAGSAVLTDPEVRRAAWPSTVGPVGEVRRASLLGGSGIARLAVGQGNDALDLELRAMGQHGSTRSRRLALRLGVGGRTILGDLDDLTPRVDGWDLASASHNTVIVDGLNQRETLRMMREDSSGGDVLFFAADPDFQVASFDDPRAYPRTTILGGYRQTAVACSGPKSRYAVAIFQVKGGSRHDQVFHATAGRWLASVPTRPWPGSLLPPSMPFLPDIPAEDGRWFVQAFGEFKGLAQGVANGPSVVESHDPGKPGVRLHLLGDAPYQVMTGSTPHAPSADDPARPALILRRGQEGGPGLESTFVTLFEPTGLGLSPFKVGRMTRTPGFVAIYTESADGPEHLVVNLLPGPVRTVQLADGRDLSTDARVVRIRRERIAMAGGTIASVTGVEVRQPSHRGRVLAAARYATSEGRGWFETDAPVLEDSGLVGRTLRIQHGDGITHGWTLRRVEPAPGLRVRLHVAEEPGFLVEGEDRHARYYQFPGDTHPGPHFFSIDSIRQ